MGDVVELNVISSLPLDPMRVLRSALDKAEERKPSRVLVILVPEDDPNHPDYFLSDPDGGTAIWDMQRLERALHRSADVLSGD